MKKHIILYFIFFILIQTHLYAKQIASITYIGLQSLSDVLANEISKIKPGDTFDEAQIDSAVIAFNDQGYFRDISVTFDDKGALRFYFVEKPRVASIEIKGYGSDQEKQTIYTQMGIKKGETFDEQKIENAKNMLKAILEYQGYYGSVIEEDLQKVSEGAYAITFNVNRGDSIIIRKAFYEGRSKLKPSVLESLSANKERDFMGWMWGLNDGKLHLQELEYDSLRIQDVYMRHGFLDAFVSAPFLSANFNNLSATLHYRIKEGIQYSVSDIEINIDKDDIIPIEELQKALSVKKDAVFNIENLRADAQTLKRLVADKGYAFAQVRPDLDKDEANGKVKVLYHIQAGNKVYISDVLISGNNRTGDRIIRREILLAPGDLYSLTKLAESQNALRRLGFFDDIKIDERRVSEDSMDLLITVKEGRTGQLQFGLGYGSYGGLMINGSITERNLFGTGQTGSIYANISTGTGKTYTYTYYGYTREYNGRQFSGNISLSNPRVFDSKFSTSASIYGNYYINYQYTEQSGGFSLSAGRLLLPTLRVSLGYDINIVKTYDFVSSIYQRYYASTSESFTDSNINSGSPVYGLWSKSHYLPITSSLTPSISFDNTDDYYFPKNGVIASAYAQFAGIGGDVRNVKAYAKLGLYYHLRNLIGIDLIARYKVQGGFLFRYSSEDFLPLNQTFYMGGVTTIRGFRSGSVTPYDEYGLWIGGDGMFTNSVELSYGLLEAAKMRLALFFDYGFLSFATSTKGSRQADFKNYGILGATHDLEWRAAIGLAVEWVSPIGPIVLIFPFKRFNERSSDYTSSFEFSMGTRF